ncbi:MAG: S-methyl-5-thioribose-1-phosphate isomerase [Desulfoarculaceae bacterium]|nr:S-methyl-5-thioribose-1-phosphate isomerase [Desulfoarculaceae bacterium]
MNINGRHFRTIWPDPEKSGSICIIDQRQLPHQFVIESLTSLDDSIRAIKDMHVRGAGLIGATAGFGMYLAAMNAPHHGVDEALEQAATLLNKSRPTARNLGWAVERVLAAVKKVEEGIEKKDMAYKTACDIADEDAAFCRQIGVYGLKLIAAISKEKNGEAVNILTHCNAGWLAFVDYGSATAPIYAARDAGIAVHVWVDETRPWNQGAKLTAWELQQEGIANTLITDNTGGHLMQNGMVDLVIVGSDRTTHTGDVANKIGTYLKALAAHDNGIPFYVALPSSTFDWELEDGTRIPIEQRSGDEITRISGMNDNTGRIETVRLAANGTQAVNYSFDVTPARLISGLITERGIIQANKEAIHALFPEKKVKNEARTTMQSTEQRRFIRKDALHLLDYLVIDQHGLQTTYSMGRTLDVSENGLKLETTQPISKGDTLLITVGVEDDLIDLRGDVVHTEILDGRYVTGIEFQDISVEGRRIFKKYGEAFRSKQAQNP